MVAAILRFLDNYVSLQPLLRVEHFRRLGVWDFSLLLGGAVLKWWAGEMDKKCTDSFD